LKHPIDPSYILLINLLTLTFKKKKKLQETVLKKSPHCPMKISKQGNLKKHFIFLKHHFKDINVKNTELLKSGNFTSTLKINLFSPADFQNIRRKKKKNHGKQASLKNKVILFLVKRTNQWWMRNR